MALRLLTLGVRAIRVGRPEKVRSAIEDMTLEAEVKKEREKREFNKSNVLDTESQKSDDQRANGKGASAKGPANPKAGAKGKGSQLMADLGDDAAGEAAAKSFEERRARTKEEFALQMKIL